MNHLSVLTERPIWHALEQAKRESRSEIEVQAKKTARAYEAWQEERQRLEAMYQRNSKLREW